LALRKRARPRDSQLSRVKLAFRDNLSSRPDSEPSRFCSWSSAIGPESIALRLPAADWPRGAPARHRRQSSARPVGACFVIQRRFTANAAHALRTPLTIITAHLDTPEGNGQVSALSEEVAQINRLVEQLLCVARLDSVALDVSSPGRSAPACRPPANVRAAPNRRGMLGQP
jgi:signal transduction histidine kinase